MSPLSRRILSGSITAMCFLCGYKQAKNERLYNQRQREGKFSRAFYDDDDDESSEIGLFMLVGSITGLVMGLAWPWIPYTIPVIATYTGLHAFAEHKC